MSRAKGDIGEKIARDYLRDNGFNIVCCNYYTKYGEIDIIATKDNIYHFVEVKSGSYIEPLDKITRSKLKRIYKSIDVYLYANKLSVSYSVDVIRIFKGKIELFSNISYEP